MLFDLEDYTYARIIGTNSLPADQISWVGPHTTARATRDAYLKSVNEYVLAAGACSSAAEKKALESKYFEFLDALRVLGPAMRQFWNAMVSLPLKASGFEEGDGFYIMEEGTEFTNISYSWPSGSEHLVEYPKWYQNEYYQNFRAYAFAATHGDAFLQSIVDGYSYAVSLYTYTALTQEIYDEYEAAMKAMQLIAKEIMLMGEGRTSFEEYVTPEIPAWDGYPELSGYVRGINSVGIAGATVRLIDADGEAFEKVTDEKGYYKFDKELFYTSIALGTASTVDIFLKPTVGSASLYDEENIFQNSFFGAENDRGFTWPVSIKMGKPARRNIKIEFIPDYTDYPSFSGYVKDAAGNPIKDAFVCIKDPNSGYSIGQYRKPNGDDAWNYKYNDFGVDRTILTDENGFYEYTSQMVGEWFNKHGFVEYDMPTTILSEPTRVYEETGSNTLNRWMMSNEFIVYLIPYKQDADSTSMNWGDGTAIYNGNDYAASRFEYGLYSEYGHFYYRDIEMGQSNVFNVDVVPAVGNEVMADKIKMTCTPGSRNIGGEIYSTSNYCKFVFSNGYSTIVSSYFGIDNSNYDYDTEFYVYSCDSEGRALGYITKLVLSDTEFSNVSNVDFSETEHLAKLTIWGLHASELDLSGLKKLKNLYLAESQYLESVTGLQDSKYLSRLDLQNTNRLSNLALENLDWLSEVFVIGTALSSFDISTCGKKANTWGPAPLGAVDVELNGMEYLQSINFGFVGHKPCSESPDSRISLSLYNCKKLLVDDVDLLMQQLADSGKLVYLNTDKARSSDSDAAYDTLISRNSSLNFGSEYFESNEEKKSVVMYLDPSFGPNSDSHQKAIHIEGSIATTTGYFRLKSWFDNGNPDNHYVWNNSFTRTINVEFDDTFESRPIEIYSTDQYGRPSGSITSITINPSNFDSHKNIIGLDITQATELTSLSMMNLGLTSLDVTSNVLLQNLSVENLGNLTSVDVTGLASLISLYLSNINSLVSIEGIETLAGLTEITLSNCQELDFVSLSALASLRNITLSDVFKYDSTHVDTMLSELNANSAAGVLQLDTQIASKQAELDAKQATLDLASDDLQTLNTDLNLLISNDTLQADLAQLISDGADQALIDAKQAEIAAQQALIDAKQAEVDAKQAEADSLYNQYLIISDALNNLNSERSNYFNGRSMNTGYMARTSASDADYDSLIAFGWNLYLGYVFFAPYTLPVKGYITLDWDGNDQRYCSFRYLQTSTGYYRFKDGMGDIYSNSNFYAYKGILEFWSVDQFGRPTGQFTGLGFDNEFATSVDFDNLTSLTTLSLGETKITTIDVSSLTNLVVFECMFDRQLASIAGLSLLANLETLYLRECNKLTSVDTSGLESLTTLYLDTLPSLSDIDISAIGSTFSSLTSLSIFNQSFDTPKHLGTHANINNINYNYFRTFTSADLDTLLAELDANGLSSGSLSTGYVARTETSDVAYSSLQSKGWSLSLGSYFIGPNEAPSKGYIHFEETAANESIQFYVGSQTDYLVVKYPDGSIETKNGGWIYYDFNSDIPVSERVFEIYGADQFGRPTNSINYIDSSSCSSLDVSALKNLASIGITNNQSITILDLDGISALKSIGVNNCPLLGTVSIVGCTASKNAIFLTGCPQLDIDSFLIQLDETGSIPDTGEYWQNIGLVESNTVRSHASDAAVESLQSKGFNIRVSEPAGDSIQIISHGTAAKESWADPNDYFFDICVISSSGYAKVVFEPGSYLAIQYPNGRINNGGRWDSYLAGNLQSISPYSLITNYDNCVSQNMTIFSCTEDGTPSGEIRYLRINGMARISGSYSDLTKLKGLSLDTKALKAQKISSVSLAGMSLVYFGIDHNGWVESYQGTYIPSIDLAPIASTLKGFSYNGTYRLDYPGTSVTGIDFADLQYIQTSGFDFKGATMSGFTGIDWLYIDSAMNLESIDFEGTMTRSQLSALANGMTQEQIDANPAYKQVGYFRMSGFDSDNRVILSNFDAITLPQNVYMNYCSLTEATDLVNTQPYSQWTINNTTNIMTISGKYWGLEVNGCPQLTSIYINCDELMTVGIDNCASLQSCSVTVNGNYNGSLNRFDFVNCPQLTWVQLNAPSIWLRQFVAYQAPLLSSVSLSANYSQLGTVNVYQCANLTQLPQALFDNAFSLYCRYSPITVNLSNNNRIYNLSVEQISGLSGLSNKPYLSEVAIWGMNIASLDFSNSFTSEANSNYSWKYLQLGNISGLTTLNLNNTKLRFLRIQGSTAQDSPSLRTSAMVDSLINALAAGGRYGGTFYFPSFPSYVTADSAAARTTLQNSRSWAFQS